MKSLNKNITIVRFSQGYEILQHISGKLFISMKMPNKNRVYQKMAPIRDPISEQIDRDNLIVRE